MGNGMKRGGIAIGIERFECDKLSRKDVKLGGIPRAVNHNRCSMIVRKEAVESGYVPPAIIYIEVDETNL